MTIVFILSYVAVFMIGGIAAKLGYFDALIEKMSKEEIEPPAEPVDMNLQRAAHRARVIDIPS